MNLEEALDIIDRKEGVGVDRLESLEVEFNTVMSTFNNCICDACHDTDTVIKIRLPHTKYHNGKVLTTKFNEYWLCVKCRSKLTRALDFPEVTE